MLLNSWLLTLRRGFARSSHDAPHRNRLQKALHAHRRHSVQIERLEQRSLLAGAGPTLVDIMTNSGALLSTDPLNPTNLNSAPSELTLKFSQPFKIDPTSLAAGLQIIGAGGLSSSEGFRSASAYSDFGSNGAVTLRLAAQRVGPGGNGITVALSTNALATSAVPVTGVAGKQMAIILSSNPLNPTTANDLVTALQSNALVTATQVGGSASAVIGNAAINNTTLTLSGANAAFARSSLSAVGAEALFTAKTPGLAGNQISLAFSAQDLGLNGGPVVQVVGNKISVTVNNHAGAHSILSDVITALNSNAAASGLVTMSLSSGFLFADVSGANQTVTLGGADNVITPGLSTVLDSTNAGNLVTVRFASTLPNDKYIVEMYGFGSPIKDTNGNAAGNGADVQVKFNLDYGPQVLSVVPQPVTVNADGTVTQSTTTVQVSFDNTVISPAVAQNPAFYQLIDTASGGVFLPQVVMYDAQSHIATLSFPSIPPGIMHLKIGEAIRTSAVSIPLGTLFGNTKNAPTPTGPAANYYTSAALPLVNDVALYGFDVQSASTITAGLDVLAAANLKLRLFNSTGLQVASSTTGTLTQAVATGHYYLGIASKTATYTVTVDNTTNTASAMNVAGGSTAGAYKLTLNVSNALTIATDTTSFTARGFSSGATNLGTIGLAGQSVQSTIQPLLGTLYAPLPGGTDEPGHRNLPTGQISAEENDAGSGTTPGNAAATSVITYDFRDIYGVDAQNNPLHNQITENQKQRAREIFQIYSAYPGLTFREVSSGGQIGIVTGDPRAVSPNIDPTSVGGIEGGGLALVNGNGNYGNSEFGGSWFQVAFHEIGHAIGLSHSYDVPSIMGPGLAGTEPVFPGDVNLVALERLHPPASTDINLYKVQVPQAGTFTAEAFAQRTGSNLDTLLTIYQEDASGNRTVIARNDNYFGTDSYLNLHLAAGTYYVAVSSTGNSDFDPNVVDSGWGGRTQGTYNLKLNLIPDITTGTGNTSFADSGVDGVAGNADDQSLDAGKPGQSGGVYNFWFESNTNASPSTVTNTVFVNKTPLTTPNPAATIGSAARPFNTIQAAFSAANLNPNIQIIRIVGNLGGDGDANTIPDSQAYLVGFDSLSNPLADGTTFKVPQNVTVMIDAGALIKFKGAVIDVGTSSPGVDRSGGAIQVLGTPTRQVYLTSLDNNVLGGPTDAIPVPGPKAGDWGGIIVRQDADAWDGSANAPMTDANGKPIFLNTVNNASISYGGGSVNIDSVSQVVDPIELITARPTISWNTITASADAAMSANPNSFDDRQGRIGPDVHSNTIIGNSINGFFIGIPTPLSSVTTTLTVPARLFSTDITYVITENLVIAGAAGGALDPATGLTATPGSLIVDPGAVIKLQGARIEAQIGSSQIVAEGTPQNPIIFTSLKDNSYGAGGTFLTSNDATAVPAVGDWGGFYFGMTSFGSIANAVIAYGGGTTPIEGGFDNFNAVDIEQAATVRITDSTLRNNASGAATTSRNGRLQNGSAVIFVRGAQPILVNNVIQNNTANAISINANALNFKIVHDWGRSVGNLAAAGQFYQQFIDNHGPLVRLNRVGSNSTNGMEVRGEIITTDTVWDDTDIVHVVRSEVQAIENLHTYGGVRLQSSADASLVVKLTGANAGFTADGVPLDISDRIGGTVQIVGTAQHPVVLTSLSDDTAGAGYDPFGKPEVDTNNDGISTGQSSGGTFTPTPGPIAVTYNTVANQLRDTLLGPGIATVGNATLVGGNLSTGTFKGGFNSIGIDSGIVLTTGDAKVAQGPKGSYVAQTTLASGSGDPQLDAAFNTQTTDTSSLTFDFTATGGSLFFNFVFASNEYNTFVNSSFNDVFAFFLDGKNIALIPGTNTPVSINTVNGGNPIGTMASNPQYYNNNAASKFPDVGYNGFTTVFTAQALNLTAGNHTIKMAVSDVSDTVVDTAVFLQAQSFSNVKVPTAATGAAGDWRSVKLNQNANDRNVAIVNETETPAVNVDLNKTPATAQFLGNLASGPNVGDGDQPLGYEVHGSIRNKSDADVYSFSAKAGTEVWLDIGQTTYSLDSVLELVDANGKVLASSHNNSTNARVLGGLALPFVKDATLGGQFYATNPRDQGFRVTLPGTLGQQGTYYVRVRSNPLYSVYGTLSDDGTQGLSQGVYQLQVRTQQVYEHPGSVVRYADIRFATNGIEVHGLPSHSNLAGEAAAPVDGSGNQTNTNVGAAQDLGNLLSSDRNVLSVAGSLSSATQVDWYKFNLNYNLIQVIGGLSNGAKAFPMAFHVGYADGLTRPDTTLSVFDANGRLILVARDSNITDEQSSAYLNGTAVPQGSSFGKLDPFLGSVSLPAGAIAGSDLETGPGGTPPIGSPSSGNYVYYVAVSSNAVIPPALDAQFNAGSGHGLVRLEPVNSVKRIVEDHIGFTGYQSGSTDAIVQPVNGPILPIASATQLGLEVTAFTLSDVALFDLFRDGSLYTLDPTTGTTRSRVTGGYNAGYTYGMMRSDGTFWADESLNNVDGTVGQIQQIDPYTGQRIGNAIHDNIPGSDPKNLHHIKSDVIDSFAFTEGNPSQYTNLYLAAHGDFNTGLDQNGNLILTYSPRDTSTLYVADPNSKTVPAANRGDGFVGVIQGGAVNASANYDFNTVAPNRVVLNFKSQQLAGAGNGDQVIVTKSAHAAGQPSVIVTDAPNSVTIDLNTVLAAATATTDFNTGGLANVRFTANNVPGQANYGYLGNNISLTFTRSDHLDTSGPTVSVVGTTINVDYNTNAGATPATAKNVADAINSTPAANALITATVLLGPNVNVSNRAITYSPVQLAGGQNPSTAQDVITALQNDAVARAMLVSGVATTDVATSVPNPHTITLSGGGGVTGATTGMSWFQGQLWGGNDKGQLYNINQGNASISNVIDLSVFGVTNITSLTPGPQNVANGIYAKHLFAMTNLGLVAIDLDPASATYKQLAADFPGGTTSVGGVGGWLGFNPVDYNLWHPTTRRSGDAGHGVNVVGDNTRNINFGNNLPNGKFIGQNSGGASFYFGNEQYQQGNPSYFTYGQNGQYGVVNSSSYQSLAGNGTLNNTYAAPGGAAGALTTGSFSLAGYSRKDKPTLYFNYFLDTRNSGGSGLFNFPNMYDSARVDISTDGGTTWQEVATNNPVKSSNGSSDAELPSYGSVSTDASAGVGVTNQTVQQLYNNTGTWRQARVDLANWGGQANLKLRFDFSTYGASRDATQPGFVAGSLPGDTTGVVNGSNNSTGVQAGNANAHEGWYVDDLIVGFAERGEMVTGDSSNDTGTFTNLPAAPAGYPFQVTTGPYQLEMRRATEYTTNTSSSGVGQVISQTFDTNGRQINNVNYGVGAQTFGFETGQFNGFPWVTYGDQPFTISTAAANAGGTRSAAAGAIKAGQTSTLEFTTDTVAGVASFYRKLTSTNGHSKLTFYIDGVATSTTSTTTAGFQLVTANVLTAGRHDFKWVWSKDASASVTDTAYIDDILIPGTGTSTVLQQDDFETGSLSKLPWTTGGNSGFFASFGGFAGTTNSGVYSARSGFITASQTSTLQVQLTTDAGPVMFMQNVTSTGGHSTLSFFVDGVLQNATSTTTVAFQPVTVNVSKGTHIFLWVWSKDASGTFADTAYIDDVVFPGTPSLTPLVGDRDVLRQQGRLEITNNTVSNTQGTAILIQAGNRDATKVPHPGSALNLPVLNNDRLVPGVDIANNVINTFGGFGIQFMGDNTGNAPLAVVPIGRIVNNTIVGSVPAAGGVLTPQGTGIQVSNNAAPTLLNNIVANTAVAVAVDNSALALGTVVGTSVFQNNTTNGVAGTNSPIGLLPTDPLFVNPAGGNFYLAEGSKAIDSALNTLQERPDSVAVKASINLPPSPLIAPSRDRFGQLRVDDPNVPNASGLGSNIFKDRGAVERSDFIGPVISIIVPLDQGPSDSDPAQSSVLLASPGQVTQFVLQLTDPGIGVDTSTVVPSAFTFTQLSSAGTKVLVPVNPLGGAATQTGDYVFSYNSNTGTVTFTASSVYAINAKYVITADTTSIMDLAGNKLQGNQADGSARFTITLIGASNDAPVNVVPAAQVIRENVPLVFSTAAGTPIQVSDGDAFLGTNQVQVTVSVSHGTLNLSGVAGLVFQTGTGTGDTLMTFTGTLPNVDAALQGLVYTPALDFVGNDVLTITTNDLGNFGVPPSTPMITTSQVNITTLLVNKAPVIDPVVGPIHILETGTPGVFTLTLTGIGPGRSEVQTLTLQTGTNNPGLFAVQPQIAPTSIPNASGTAGTATLTFTPAAFSFGTATIAVLVTDNGGLANGGVNSTAVNFQVIVDRVNQAPAINPVSNMSVRGDSVNQTITLTGINAGRGDSDQTFTVTAASGTLSVISNPVVVVGLVPDAQGNRTATLTYSTAHVPVNVPVLITLTEKDNGGTLNGGVDTTTTSFVITVTPWNHPPVAQNDVLPAINEDSPAITIPASTLLANDSPGPADESAQTLTITGVGSVVGGSAVLSGGKITFTPAPFFSGTASFIYAVTDNGTTNGVADPRTATASVMFSVLPVNHAPVRLTGNVSPLVVLQDSGTTSLGLGGVTYSPGPDPQEAIQSLTYTVTALPPSSLGQVVLAADGTPVVLNAAYQLSQIQGMQFRVAAHMTGGPATFSYTVTDSGGVANGGHNSLTESLTITVNPNPNIIPTQRMYRTYNPNAGQHFFTTSFAEFQSVVAAGYKDESTGQPGWAVATTQVSGTLPIHRLYNVATGWHYLTLSDGERDALVNLVPPSSPNYATQGWRFEGDIGFLYNAKNAADTEIYMLYNNNSGEHFYTADVNERNSILQQFQSVWSSQTSLGFGFFSPIGSNSVTTSAAPATAKQASAAPRTSAETAAQAAPQSVSSTATATAVQGGFDLQRGSVDGGVKLPTLAAMASAVPQAPLAETRRASSAANEGDSSLDSFWRKAGSGLLAGALESDLW